MNDRIRALLIHIDGYKLIHRPKSCSAHGGLAIYIRHLYEFDEVYSLRNNTDWEALFVKLRCTELSGKSRDGLQRSKFHCN